MSCREAQSVSVLGCGWLGLPLALRLLDDGWLVRGSTTDTQKIPRLQSLGIDPFVIHASPEVSGDHISRFFQSRILWLNIPFRRDLVDPDYYRIQVESVVNHAVEGGVEWIIFASSTSVYPAAMSLADESTPFVPETPRSEILFGVEKYLLESDHFDATVIRFAGLFGPDRQVGKWLAKKNGIIEGDSPINLIHLDDCIGIATSILEQNSRREIFNACADEHPTREALYKAAAKVAGLPVPEFSRGVTSHPGKIVCNRKVKETLGYQFLYPDPLSVVISGSGEK
jgi:nucleoside-diphosphate-sugar epimerase